MTVPFFEERIVDSYQNNLQTLRDGDRSAFAARAPRTKDKKNARCVDRLRAVMDTFSAWDLFGVRDGGCSSEER